ncbi:MAG: glycosyl transferase [Deltaproteobacteria bacterium]|nr:glycosyl transferase [Deltaproteobacteria bacterium]MBW2393590.1 glycosyl transferase [Deltaproteobacteria bacterium]
MADFHQTGVISTLHRLGRADLRRLERDLAVHGNDRPVALVLPCLHSELKDVALKGIIDQLRSVDYLEQVIVSVAGTTCREEYEEMCNAFEGVRTRHGEPATLLWNDGPRIQELYRVLREEGLDAGPPGKGQGVWLAFGYVLAAGRSRVIALHDCDIRDYDRELLARLCFPIANSNMNYEFVKGYYARVTDRLYGRVTRLFMTPFLRAMKSVLGPNPLLEFLDSFRFPLAGECAMTTDLARSIRIPSDWGLEVGVLAEVYRNCSLKRICQVELTENYDHKHRELEARGEDAGLHRMVTDIGTSLIRNLASYGIEFDAGFLNTLGAAYVRMAQDAVARYSDDAALNGLAFDRHEEEVAVETFSSALRGAGLGFVRDPLGAPQIPNWNRVTSAVPEILELLREAVQKDSQA